MFKKQIRGGETYTGSNANRLKFFPTPPKNGVEWYEDDTEILYRVINGDWVVISSSGLDTWVADAKTAVPDASHLVDSDDLGTAAYRPVDDFAVAEEFDTLLDYWSNNASSGRLWGGELSYMGAGIISIAPGAGIVKLGGDTIDCNLECIPIDINEGQGSLLSLVEWDETEIEFAGVGYNIIYWDASASAFVVSLKEDLYTVFNFVTDFTVGRIYYDGTEAVIRLCGMNRWNFERRVQMFGEERFPVERALGLMISGTGTRNIALTAGVVWAELVNRFSVEAFDSSGADRFTYWYRGATPGTWTSILNQSQINNTQYDDGDGSLATLTPNRYGVHWVYVVHDSSVHVVFGQGDYTLAQSALSSAPATLPGILAAYATFVGRIIIQRNSATFQEVASPFTQTILTSSVTDHNDLSGLQGGTAGEYYHLTAAEAGKVSNLGNADIVAVAAGRDLLASDAGKTLECNGTFTLTGPNGIITNLQCEIVNVGAGVITLAATTTLQSKGSAVLLQNQYDRAKIYHRGANVWLATGDLS